MTLHEKNDETRAERTSDSLPDQSAHHKVPSREANSEQSPQEILDQLVDEYVAQLRAGKKPATSLLLQQNR